MNTESVKVFERLSGWTEYHDFQTAEEGYITHERVGDTVAFFFWRVDKDPCKLDSMYMDGNIYVRYSDNAH